MKLVTVHSLKGGVGKSLIALYIAVRESQRQADESSRSRRVLLVDMDVLGSTPFMGSRDHRLDRDALTLGKIIVPHDCSASKPLGPLQLGVQTRDAQMLVVENGSRFSGDFSCGPEFIGLTDSEKEDLGNSRSEVQAFREFRAVSLYLKQELDDEDLAVIDMPAGYGSEWRALEHFTKDMQQQGIAHHDRVLVLLPTFAEARRAARLIDGQAMRFRPVLNFVSDQAHRMIDVGPIRKDDESRRSDEVRLDDVAGSSDLYVDRMYAPTDKDKLDFTVLRDMPLILSIEDLHFDSFATRSRSVVLRSSWKGTTYSPDGTEQKEDLYRFALRYSG